MIRSPRVPHDHPERRVLCEEAMEARFFELLELRDLMTLHQEAVAAGWANDEVRYGMRNLLVPKALSDAAIDRHTTLTLGLFDANDQDR